MLRRLCTLLLALACALAPALPGVARVSAADAPADSACCTGGCRCGHTDCAPPPAPARVANDFPAATATLESRALASRALPRAGRARENFSLAVLSSAARSPIRLAVCARASDATATVRRSATQCVRLI
jgi:hypothetical protein